MKESHLNAGVTSATPEQQGEAQAIAVFLTVLKRASIVSGADLDHLAKIAQSGKRERHRIRASLLLGGWRQRAADTLAAPHVAGGGGGEGA